MGQLVNGLFMEGARWPAKDEVDDPIDMDGTPCGGHIVEMKLKEVLPTMPLLYIKSVEVQAHWSPQSIALGGKGSGAVAFFRPDLRHARHAPYGGRRREVDAGRCSDDLPVR